MPTYVAAAPFTRNGVSYVAGDVFNTSGVSGIGLRRLVARGYIEIGVADTGWRKFPEQTVTATIGAQSGISYRVSPLMRRINDDVRIGMVWARDTALTVTTSQTNVLLTTPTDWPVMPGANFSADLIAVQTGGNAATARMFYTNRVDGTVSMYLQCIATTTSQTGVTTGTDYVGYSAATAYTTDAWPTTLPGVAYP